MTKVIAQTLTIGDKILPPAREIQLWMGKALKERNLAETALHLTITDIHEGTPDKRGRWLVVTADHTPEWLNGARPYPFKFKVRPDTLWQKAQ